jgi:hypothetical protein
LVGGWSGRVRLGGGRLGRVRLGQVPRSGKTNRMRGHGVFAGKGVSGGRGGAAEIAGMPELGQIYSPPPRASMRSRACHRMLGWRHLATARDCGRQSLCVRVSVLGADCAAGLVRSGPVAVSVHYGPGQLRSGFIVVPTSYGLGPSWSGPVALQAGWVDSLPVLSRQSWVCPEDLSAMSYENQPVAAALPAVAAGASPSGGETVPARAPSGASACAPAASWGSRSSRAAAICPSWW